MRESGVKRSVILDYDQNTERLNVRLIDRAELASLLTGLFTVPILLDDFDFKLDDEFARRLGVAMLNAIALDQPDIEKYISVTKNPIEC